MKVLIEVDVWRGFPTNNDEQIVAVKSIRAFLQEPMRETISKALGASSFIDSVTLGA